ncbi:MAG: US12 family protein [Firmicutes bacterium]|nr:US12 family protein [Bacillota bacterium]
MASFSNAESKQARMFNPSNAEILDTRTYNLTIGGVVLYGIIINVLMCYYLAPQILAINPLFLLIGYFILAIAGSVLTYKSDSPVISFIGYNMVAVPVGAVLTVCVQSYDPQVVFYAFLLTAVITGVMLALATAFPGVFAGMGRMLFAALLGTLAAAVVCMIFSIQTIILSWVFAVIFALYIGYDWVKAQQYVHTLDNAVDSALDIYMDIINLFLRLLVILNRNSD